MVRLAKISKTFTIVAGGMRRQDSTAIGLSAAQKFLQKDGVVLLHNGANPFVSAGEITAVIQKIKKCGAAGVGRPVTSTVKEILHGKVTKTIPRSSLFLMETPQGIRSDFLECCIQKARTQKEYTDDLMLAEACGVQPALVLASEENCKITTEKDLRSAENMLSSLPSGNRVGFGVDQHRFDFTKKGGVLGGLSLKNMPVLHAESDGDVVFHSLATALSQAIAGGSLGTFAAPLKTKKCSSTLYVQKILKKVREKNYRINNIGIMIECVTPKIDPLVERMRKKIAALLKISSDAIGITATSGEKLTPWGKGEGIQCTVAVSVTRL